MHSRSRKILLPNSVCQITLDIKENAEVSFELWMENPDQKQDRDLGAVVLFTTTLKRTLDMLEWFRINCLSLAWYKGALKGKKKIVEQGIKVSEKVSIEQFKKFLRKTAGVTEINKCAFPPPPPNLLFYYCNNPKQWIF